MHDSAARIPLIVRYPERFPSGEICETPASLVDIAPTFLAASGAELSDHGLDGVDLADLAAGTSTREMVFSQFNKAEQGVYMVADKRWKYMYSAPDQREFLFDRIADPLETRNRAATPFMKEHASRMRKALIDHLRENGELAALDGENLKMFPKQELPDDPDAGLLIQDASWGDLRIPGYTDASD
jgi:arylsulfatase A-like enzyme